MYNLERYINDYDHQNSMKEESIFLEVVGDSPRMRILQYLIEGRNFDYTLTDMLNSGVSWGTLNSEFTKLAKLGIVVKVREVGRAKLYKINSENLIVKKLIDLYDSLIMKEINLTLKEKLVVA